MKKIIYIFFCLIATHGISQNFTQEQQHQIDSLNAIINNSSSPDTSLASAYVGLCEILYVSNLDTIIPLCSKAQEIAEKALTTHPSSPITHSLKTSLANAINNIGYIYMNQGDIPKALDYYHRSLKIQEEIGNKEGIAASLNNIGGVYHNQGDIPKALDYYHRSLKIKEEIGDKQGIAYSLNNIGLIYNNQGDIPQALEYYHQSLKIREEIGDKSGIANSLNNIGFIYKKKGDIPKASEYYHRSLKIQEEIGDKSGIAASLNNIGNIEMKLGQLAAAEKSLSSGLKTAQEVGSPEWISKISSNLSRLFKQQHRYAEALKMYELHIQMKDSLNNEDTQKASIQQQAKYEYEKQKVLDDAENEKLIAIEQQEKEKQKIITYSIGVGLGLVVIFLIFVFNRLQVTKKQKKVIETQKQVVENQKEVVELAHHELEEKNQEITDSIIYAKRIQSAILPPLKVVKEYLTRSFILYKPKDIVAGDFYWMETVSGSRHSELVSESDSGQKTLKQVQGDVVLFAACDCTGHGVPGAMVSVVCNNALNRSVREHDLTDPGQILDKTREIVIQEFEKSDEEVKDGMDIALCSLELNSPLEGRQRGEIKYAGANNPLWIVRHSELVSESEKKMLNQVQHDDYILLETKANKQPIGKSDNAFPFTTHTIELQKGDTIYIFSDGYVDQFGGEKGKKFKAKAFKELLLSIQDKTMDDQKNIIDTAFETWKGNLEQIDDVCVIGVRV